MADAVSAVLDSLGAEVALLDADGTVIAVNAAWRRFGEQNGLRLPDHGLGTNYLEYCESARGDGAAEARQVVRGVRSVLARETDEFSLEYACHAPSEERYFLVRVTRFAGSGPARILVSHEDVTELRRAEAAYRSSERRFRSLIENATDVITILDPEGGIGYESPSVERVLRYSPDQRVGRSLFDFVHATDLGQVLGAFGRCLTRPSDTVALEYRCRDASGSWRSLEGTMKNLLADPAVAGIVVNTREVTARKLAEEAQARLTAVMDATPDFVATADPHGRLSYLNESARRMLELEGPADAQRVNLTDLHPAWANERLLHEALPTAIRDGVWTGETALLNAAGLEVPVIQVILAHKTRSGAVDFFSTTARDITDRKRAEEELRDSHELFRQIAENINEALWIYDAETARFLYLSPGYERIWGQPRRRVYEDPTRFLAGAVPLHDDGERAVTELWSGTGRDTELRITRPDGATRWIRGRSFRIRDSAGQVGRVVGLMEDVTERQQLDVELRRAHRLEAIGHLAAGVAHEINTPVQYVSDNVHFLSEGFVSLARIIEAQEAVLRLGEAGAPLPAARLAELAEIRDELDVEYVLAEVPRALDQSGEGIGRVADIVRAMKEFAHPGTSEKRPTDLNRAVQSTLTVARNEWKYVAELETDFDLDLPPVPCLPSELNQAVLNIVVNAAHAITDAAEGPEPRGLIRVSTRRDGDWAELRISDTGPGIPEAVRTRIFDPFFTTKEVGRGTGQGLTLAHAVVVEKHGGSLDFETEPGVGTTFVIRLPLDTGGPGRDGETQAEDASE